jgi:hypothetical protein
VYYGSVFEAKKEILVNESQWMRLCVERMKSKIDNLPQNLILEEVASELATATIPLPRSWPALRDDSRQCSICRGTENCRGLDAFVRVRHEFRQHVRGYYHGFERYIGVLKLRFCDRCIPPSEVDAGCRQSRRRTFISIIIGLLITAVSVVAISKSESIFPFVSLSVGILLVLFSFGYGATYLRADPEKSTWKYYEQKADAILLRNRKTLLDQLDLRAYDLDLRPLDGFEVPYPVTIGPGFYPATPEHVTFEVEPSGLYLGHDVTARNGVKWNYYPNIYRG